ncbi:MAG: HAMP domain-containing sensor histidine kinase [Bacteroidota bacterium]
MIEIVTISLENEMDLVLAHKRSMRVAERIGLTTATQTTFATAVSEIARCVIEHTDKGILVLALEQKQLRYSLVASVIYDSEIKFTNNDSGYFYAQKLVPEFLQSQNEQDNRIEMKFGVPRSLKLDPRKISMIRKFFAEEDPINAYDEIKQRNLTLKTLAEQKEEELRQSRIIDEKKTEFISVASHEIKTPITIIKAYTQMAKGMKTQCSDQVAGILEKVDAQTNKLLLLIQQLLDITKIENGSLQYNKEVVEINSFVSEMCDVIRHIYPHHTITHRLCNELKVNIDRIRMEQVFSNLLGNAAKYSSKNSEIFIECVDNQNGMAQISVKDQGIGMSLESTKLIFEKFYRDKDVVKTHSGLGMGLYVASKIIVDHGGSIWVESKEDRGSTFYFSLPVNN